MQSYSAMLGHRQQLGEPLPKDYRPTFRSSAIFPVIENAHVHSRVLFMGYWLLKRHIREIGMLVTLRSAAGEMLDRSYLRIDSPRAFNVDVPVILSRLNRPEANFTGSLELEIFSTVDLVFPYPAFVLNYYGDDFSTTVHSVGRIYNDVEDMMANQEYEVREAGFDIHATNSRRPFVAFTNGPMINPAVEFEYEAVNSDNEKLSGTIAHGPAKPFETCFLDFAESIPGLSAFLAGERGTINIGHNLKGLFPRFVVGNKDINANSVSITHSYYDSSPVGDSKAYWKRSDSRFIDSAIAIPVFAENGYSTQLVIYPIFSASEFSISLTYYRADGSVLGAYPEAAKVDEKRQQYQTLDLGALSRGVCPRGERPSTVRIECNWKNKDRIPTRVKFGLNVGKSDNLPSNICFAPQLANPNILLKKGTFKWSPMLNMGVSEVVLTNSCPLIDYRDPAVVQLKFYREADDACLERTVTLPPFGSHRVSTAEDAELSRFLDGRTGWMTATSENPNIYGWYFDFAPSGATAADHIF